MYKESARRTLSFRFVHGARSPIDFSRRAAAIRRSMSSSHEERTATEPRGKSFHNVVLQNVETVNENIRLIRLNIPEEKLIEFRPGQWVDLYIPGLRQAGGFTITSTPDQAKGSLENGYLELAVQKSPGNPAAAWLWQQSIVIINSELMVRLGGNFVWPPPNVKVQDIKKVVFVAGGVGINPLVSMLSHLYNYPLHLPISVQFLYTTQVPRDGYSSLLFFSHLNSIFKSPPSPDWNLNFYLTGSPTPSSSSVYDPSNSTFFAGEDYKVLGANQCIHERRVTHEDLFQALGPVSERRGVAAYVCGPSRMTDEFINVLGSQEGMEERRVLCEKWW